jgi:hypothetical protein
MPVFHFFFAVVIKRSGIRDSSSGSKLKATWKISKTSTGSEERKAWEIVSFHFFFIAHVTVTDTT